MCPSPSHFNSWTGSLTLNSCENLDIYSHPAPSKYLNIWVGAFNPGPSLPCDRSDSHWVLSTDSCPSLPFFSPHPQLCEMFYSVTKHLPGPQQQAFKELQGLEDFIAEKVEQSQRALDPNSPWNLIDSFFIRMQEVHASSQ